MAHPTDGVVVVGDVGFTNTFTGGHAPYIHQQQQQQPPPYGALWQQPPPYGAPAVAPFQMAVAPPTRPRLHRSDALKRWFQQPTNKRKVKIALCVSAAVAGAALLTTVIALVVRKKRRDKKRDGDKGATPRRLEAEPNVGIGNGALVGVKPSEEYLILVIEDENGQVVSAHTNMLSSVDHPDTIAALRRDGVEWWSRSALEAPRREPQTSLLFAKTASMFVGRAEPPIMESIWIPDFSASPIRKYTDSIAVTDWSGEKCTVSFDKESNKFFVQRRRGTPNMPRAMYADSIEYKDTRFGRCKAWLSNAREDDQHRQSQPQHLQQEEEEEQYDSEYQ